MEFIEKSKDIPVYNYYVIAEDTFFTKFFRERLKNKRNVLIFGCETAKEADCVYNNAMNRTEMIRERIIKNKPRLKKTWYAQFKSKKEYSSWYKEGYFSK